MLVNLIGQHPKLHITVDKTGHRKTWYTICEKKKTFVHLRWTDLETYTTLDNSIVTCFHSNDEIAGLTIKNIASCFQLFTFYLYQFSDIRLWVKSARYCIYVALLHTVSRSDLSQNTTKECDWKGCWRMHHWTARQLLRGNTEPLEPGKTRAGNTHKHTTNTSDISYGGLINQRLQCCPRGAFSGWWSGGRVPHYKPISSRVVAYKGASIQTSSSLGEDARRQGLRCDKTTIKRLFPQK